MNHEPLPPDIAWTPTEKDERPIPRTKMLVTGTVTRVAVIHRHFPNAWSEAAIELMERYHPAPPGTDRENHRVQLRCVLETTAGTVSFHAPPIEMFVNSGGPHRVIAKDACTNHPDEPARFPEPHPWFREVGRIRAPHEMRQTRTVCPFRPVRPYRP